MNKSLQPPNGTLMDLPYLFAGSRLTKSEAASIEQAVQIDPHDLASRLLLMGFLEAQDPHHPELASHILWLIDRHPTHELCETFAGLGPTTSKFRHEVAIRCIRQASQTRDVRVVYNAALFLRQYDPGMSDKLCLRAKKMEPQFAAAALHLAYEYQYRAHSAKGDERRRWVKRAVKEANAALACQIEFDERMQLLLGFTGMAVRYDHLAAGNKFAKQLHELGKFSDTCVQYSLICLSWIDFKQGHFRALRKRLKRLARSFEQSRSIAATCFASLALVRDIQDFGHTALAQEILTILAAGAGDDHSREKEELEEWFTSIGQGRKPKLKILRKTLLADGICTL